MLNYLLHLDINLWLNAKPKVSAGVSRRTGRGDIGPPKSPLRHSHYFPHTIEKMETYTTIFPILSNVNLAADILPNSSIFLSLEFWDTFDVPHTRTQHGYCSKCNIEGTTTSQSQGEIGQIGKVGWKWWMIRHGFLNTVCRSLGRYQSALIVTST